MEPWYKVATPRREVREGRSEGETGGNGGRTLFSTRPIVFLARLSDSYNYPSHFDLARFVWRTRTANHFVAASSRVLHWRVSWQMCAQHAREKSDKAQVKSKKRSVATGGKRKAGRCLGDNGPAVDVPGTANLLIGLLKKSRSGERRSRPPCRCQGKHYSSANPPASRPSPPSQGSGECTRPSVGSGGRCG